MRHKAMFLPKIGDRVPLVNHSYLASADVYAITGGSGLVAFELESYESPSTLRSAATQCRTANEVHVGL